MICENCHSNIADNSTFCNYCGARQNVAPVSGAPAPKRLMRSVTDCKIAGVCGGIAEYFDMDSSIVRLVWVLVVLMPIPFVPAFIGYFVAWIVMPKAPLPAVAKAPPPPIVIPNSTQTA
ncbi:MAG: PspC domain-containing protein [Acidobacteria bacterium]|nr:PspC domain-containing protein [Acidobacteriota bacterium]